MSEDEWVNHCQLIMKANTGIDFIEFQELLKYITMSRGTRIAETLKVNFSWPSAPVTQEEEPQYCNILRLCSDTLIQFKNIIADRSHDGDVYTTLYHDAV